jgi:hypothetical protein
LPSPAEKYCPGKKRTFEGGKENSLGKFFSTFLSLKGWDVEKNFTREISFPSSNILFFPGTIFFSGSRKFLPREILYFMIQKRLASKQPQNGLLHVQKLLFLSPKNSSVIFVIF